MLGLTQSRVGPLERCELGRDMAQRVLTALASARRCLSGRKTYLGESSPDCMPETAVVVWGAMSKASLRPWCRAGHRAWRGRDQREALRGFL